jgi:uncharacterized HAD superfamily protein
MKIGIDIDDVLIDFCAPFVEYHNEHYGTDWKEMNSYRLEDLTGDTWEQMQEKMDRFVEDCDIFNRKIDPIIKESFEKISRNHDIYIITGRPSHYVKETKRWAEENLGGLYKDIFFVYENGQEQKQDKWEFCKKHGIEVMIEDLEEFATKCNENGIKVLLFNHTWNQGVEGKNITRVQDWQEIERVLDNEKASIAK